MKQSITPKNLKSLIEEQVTIYPEKANTQNIWRKPLVVTATADHRFDILPGIVSKDHALPKDLLPSAKSVVVFFLPFTKALAVENHNGRAPARNWGLAYKSTNQLIHQICFSVKAYLIERGYNAALMPATHNSDPKTLVSKWSHKHLGYIAGLGRFGVNAQLITPSGCAGRLGSLVTDADFGDTPLVKTDELCLHKNGHWAHTILTYQMECSWQLSEPNILWFLRLPERYEPSAQKWIPLFFMHQAMSGGAVSESGIDRKLCHDRLIYNSNETRELEGLGDRTHVCGKCQVFLPCSLKAPMQVVEKTDDLKGTEIV